MDIGKSLTYVFDDDRWITKIIIGGVLVLLSMFIIPIFFVQGYLLRIVRNVMDGEEHPLPEWDDWGEMFKDGLNLVIATLAYTLPIWILMCCGSLFFLPSAMSDGGDMADIMAGIGVVAILVFSCLAILFGIALALLSPAITIQYARTDDLRACFDFNTVFGIVREHLSDLIIVLVVLFGLSMVLGLIGIVPFIGWIISLFASIYVTFVSGHLFGQIGAMVGGGKEKGPDDPLLMA